MDVQLNIVRFKKELIADHDYFLELIQTEGLDSFRKPDPEMEEASAALSKLFGQDVPAHSAVTVTMDSSNLELQEKLALLAYYHGLVVFIGTTDILFNATGISTSSNGLSSIRNCMGTMWRQVSRPMLDRAFEDALRLPVSEQTWIQVINYGSEVRSYGLEMSMHVRASGQFELIWSSLPPEATEPVFRTLTVDTYEEAREILLSFSDHNPLIEEFAWEPLSQRASKPILDPSVRHETPWRRLDAVKELPEGVMVHLHKWPTFSLAYGRNAQGQWTAKVYDNLGTDNVQTFDIADEVIAVAEHYLDGNGEIISTVFPDSSSSDPAPYTTVTAMELPEREEQWTEASVCMMHRIRADHNGEPSPRMQKYIETINTKLGSEILLAEEQVEAQALTRLLIPADVRTVTIERLTHLAQDYGISLVVDDSLALYNPSGKPLPGAESCQLKLLADKLYVNTWEVAPPSSVLEAGLRLFTGWRLEVRSGSQVDFQERYTLVTTYTGDNVSLDLVTPDGKLHKIPSTLLPLALDVMVEFTYSPTQLVDKVNWQDQKSSSDIPEEERFMVNATVFGSAAYLFNDELLEAVCQDGFPEVGAWVAAFDRIVPGDYCQVDRVEPSETGAARYLVEWGHNNGEEENFQMLLEDIDEALSLLERFVNGDRAEFEALPWTRRVE
ncbi:hypothetical protein [Corynebacterium striatum]|uniref:hypothetical protein n=1 Tax=Corynebacterium striatum TaxID=43770 RepID=UPI00321FFDD1